MNQPEVDTIVHRNLIGRDVHRPCGPTGLENVINLMHVVKMLAKVLSRSLKINNNFDERTSRLKKRDSQVWMWNKGSEQLVEKVI